MHQIHRKEWKSVAKRILLVDDEPLILKGLKYTLEQEGYETLSAADGQEALDVFFSNNIEHYRNNILSNKSIF